MSKPATATDLQTRAWGFYGYPGSTCKAVGEVRYVIGWLADQIARLDWRVTIDGSEDWAVKLPDGSVIRSAMSDDPETDQLAASAALLSVIDWKKAVRAITTNLFVAGQGDYIQTDNGWRTVSVLDPDRKLLLSKHEGVPFLWPHPANPGLPDAPLFSVLELLDELDWLTRQARTQSRQRVLISGIAVIADGFEGPDGQGFWDQWNTSLSARMRDPDDLSPLRLRGPLDLVKDGVNWVIPPLGYDDKLGQRVTAAIHRLAYGLPVPPEILLGMQAQSRATAFQVEENAYRAHIEPPAEIVARVGAAALSLLLDKSVDIEPDAAELLARRQSVQDVKDTYDRGEATGDYLREVLGIPGEANPNPGTITTGGGGAVSAAPRDPANVAADEPVTAAGEGDLSDLLARVDAALTSELAGVAVMCVERARQRLGAAARGNASVRSNPDYRDLTSADLASTLGERGLAAAGVNVADQIAEPVDAAARWWLRRVGEAWGQVADLVPGWAGQGDWIETSVQLLADGLVTHIVGSLEREVPPPLDGGTLRGVVDAAAGGSGGVR